MTILTIIHLPNPILRQPNSLITEFNEELQTLIDDMIETMYAANGVGLAAPQIAVNKRLSVIDVSHGKEPPLCLINPEIISKEGEEWLSEGCLSIPGAYDKAPRALKVHMRALDRHGKSYEIHAEGILAHCIQHELDHLNGKLFIDYLSPLKRKLAEKKLKKHLKRTP